MDKVCTVIVTYNGTRWIKQCLEHLLASSYPTDIIIIDNHSTDDTLLLLEPYSAKCTLIESKQNLGFGGGNNIGIKKALEMNAAFIFLLNQDAYVETDCIGSLVNKLKQSAPFGILSPLQLNSDASRLDGAFEKYLSPHLQPAYLDDINSYRQQATNREPVSVRFVNAAAWMIRRQALLKVGFFHPVFIHYGEDNNYASRMQYHGYKIGVDLNAAVVHDRAEEKTNDEKTWMRKLRTIPLYTLLDIRKPMPLAYGLGLLKLKRIKKKMNRLNFASFNEIYAEQNKWFTVKFKEALQIRKETKMGIAKNRGY
jgi:GT2 family glycosyltransferase